METQRHISEEDRFFIAPHVLPQLQAGNESAWTKVATDAHQLLIGFARRAGIGYDTIPDVIQTALMKFYEKIGEIQDTNVTNYLLTILRNIINNHHRGENRHLRTSLEGTPEILQTTPNRATPVVDKVIARGELEQTVFAIRQLPPEQREPIVLYAVYGHSPTDIAKNTRTTPEAVRARMFRGREQLRKTVGR